MFRKRAAYGFAQAERRQRIVTPRRLAMDPVRPHAAYSHSHACASALA